MIGVYELATGRLLSVGSPPTVVPDGCGFLALPEGATYGVTHTWEERSRTWVEIPAVVDTRLTVTQFRRRFTATERDRIELAQTEHPDPMVRARLRRAEKELNAVQGQIADRRDPDLQRAVAWMSTVEIDGVKLVADMTRAIEIIGADAFNPANLA